MLQMIQASIRPNWNCTSIPLGLCFLYPNAHGYLHQERRRRTGSTFQKGPQTKSAIRPKCFGQRSPVMLDRNGLALGQRRTTPVPSSRSFAQASQQTGYRFEPTSSTGCSVQTMPGLPGNIMRMQIGLNVVRQDRRHGRGYAIPLEWHPGGNTTRKFVRLQMFGALQKMSIDAPRAKRHPHKLPRKILLQNIDSYQRSLQIVTIANLSTLCPHRVCDGALLWLIAIWPPV